MRLLNLRPLVVTCIICLLGGLQILAADVFRYVDDQGQTHYVDAESKVPGQYRSQLIGAKPLPPISRERGFRLNSAAKSPAANSKTVEVFVTEWCPYCRQLEASLQANNVKYKRYDVEKSAEGEKKYRALGAGGIPITKIGDTVVRGNNLSAVLQALER